MKIIDIGWVPIKLGKSLPIQGRLWMSRLVCIVVILLGPAAVVLLLKPLSLGLSENDTRAAVEHHLAKVNLPLMQQGEGGSSTAVAKELLPPDYLESPAPGPWKNLTLNSIESESLRLGLVEFEKSRFREAVIHFQRATHYESREAWLPFYHLGITEFRLKEYLSAKQSLTDALRRLNLLEREIAPIEWAAARIAILRSLGIVTHRGGHQPEDEAEALHYFKLAIGGLELYERRIVYSKRYLFKIAPLGIDSFDVWNNLVWGYISSPNGTKAYNMAYPLATPFEQDYCLDYPLAIEESPFYWEIEGCLDQSEPLHLCWAYLNLGCVYFANKDLYEDVSTDFRASLSALAYNVAWLIANYGSTSPQAPSRMERAAQFLGLASTFSDQNSDCERRILALSRYIAFQDPAYRGLVADAIYGKYGLQFSPKNLEGFDRDDAGRIIWRLYLRWHALLRHGRPEEMMKEVEWQMAYSGDFYATFAAWKREVHIQFRDTLTEEMKKRQEQGRDSEALGIQRWRAPYLDSSWRWKAWGNWLGFVFSRSSLFWKLLAIFWIGVVLFSWIFHRAVLVPYLIYTTDYYRNEYRKRGLPTAEMIRREETRRRAANLGTDLEFEVSAKTNGLR